MNIKLLGLFILLSWYSSAQSPEQAKADEIVSFFLGAQTFKQFVTLDDKNSKHGTDQSCFVYNFRHPIFENRIHVIQFDLDSTGQYLHKKNSRGLVQITTPDSMWITASHALQICRKQAHRIRKKSLRLSWDSVDFSLDTYNSSKNFRDIKPGNLVWQLDGVVIFRGEKYSGTFDVNVITGVVTRRFAIPWD